MALGLCTSAPHIRETGVDGVEPLTPCSVGPGVTETDSDEMIDIS